MHPNYRGVAFLLSLGGLPVACGEPDKGSEGSGESTSPGTGSTTGDPTGAVTEPDTTSTGQDVTGEPTTSTTSTSSTSDSDVTTGGTDAETGEAPPPGPICEAYAAHYVECFPRYATYVDIVAGECAGYSSYGEKQDGPACGDAHEAYYVCMTRTPCADFDNEPPDLPCDAELQALNAACPSMNI